MGTLHRENRATDYFPNESRSHKPVVMERPGAEGSSMVPFAQHGVSDHRQYMTEAGDISQRNDRSSIAKTGSQIVGDTGG